MSRREPRGSSGAAQKDALHEFEQFKKKFLLANKHITKLNSQLSSRVQELESLVSTLNSENLRLHTTMISLYAELKRERSKTARAMADAEQSAIHALMKAFGTVRDAHRVPLPQPKQPSPKRSPPRVRRPEHAASPHDRRLAQPPDFPQIMEEDEGMEGDAPSPPPRRKKPRTSGSSSYYAVPASHATPSQPPSALQPAISINLDIGEAMLAPSTKKRISRRQSGLIINTAPTSSSSSLTPPRPPSPAFGSPLRLAAGLADGAGEDEEGEDPEDDVEEALARAAAAKKEKRRRLKAAAAALEGTETEESAGGAGRAREKERERERRRPRGEAETLQQGGTAGAFSLKDVTNSPIGRAALAPLDIPLSLPRRYSTPEDSDAPTSAFTSSTRPPLTTPGTTPAPSHLPTPRTSSPPPVPPPAPDPAEPPEPAGRERRVRKSVNYAEPKLNTKMRKPDGFAAEATSRRSSAAAAPRTSAEDLGLGAPNVAVRRKRSRPQMPIDEHDESEEEREREMVRGRGRGEDDEEAEYAPPLPPREREWGPASRRQSAQVSGRGRGGAEERRHSTVL